MSEPTLEEELRCVISDLMRENAEQKILFGQRIAELKGLLQEAQERVAELDAENERLTSEHESLLAFTRSEIGKLPPEYVKHKAQHRLTR